MAWNQPGNNGQDRDPWGSSNNQGGNSGGNGNKGGREQGPPDLDDIFRKLSKKLGGLGGGKGGLGGGSGSQGPRGPMGGRIVGIVAAAAVIIWAASGFYTIKELNVASSLALVNLAIWLSLALTGNPPSLITFRRLTLNRCANWRPPASC